MNKSTPILIGLFLCGANQLHAKQSAAQKAAQIFTQTGIEAGFAVHLAPEDPKLSMALTNSQKMLVHALTADDKQLNQVRNYLLNTGYYGLASAETPLQWKHLPYSNKTVNLLYTEDWANLKNKGLSLKEAWRVLQPFGSLLIKTKPGSMSRQEIEAELKNAQLYGSDNESSAKLTGSENTGFTLLAKKGAEAGTDEWTHFKYNSEGTGVSQDTKVSPPTHVKWVSGDEGYERIGIGTRPGWRIHNGKVVYVWNSGTGSNPRINQLVMRDAYNGSLIWKKDDVIQGSDLVPIVYKNQKIYTWAKGPKGYKYNADKEIIAFNEKGDEVLHWNIPDNLSPKKFQPDFGNGYGNVEMMVIDNKIIMSWGQWVIALNAEKSNEILWSYDAGANKKALWTIASKQENKVFFVVADKSHPSGDVRWPAVYGHDDIRAISLDKGQFLWKNDTWSEARTDTLFGIGQLLYHKGHLVAFVGTGGSLAADDPIWDMDKEKFGKRYMSMVSLTRATDGKPVWKSNNGGCMYKGATLSTRCYPRQWNYVAFVRDGKVYVDAKGRTMRVYDFETGVWESYSGDTKKLAESMGIPKSGNPANNQRCGRGTGTVNYWLAGYISWWDKDMNFEFKPVRRSGCASQVYPAYGMTYYSPSGCRCYTMVNSRNAGMGPGNNTRRDSKEAGGRGFIALGSEGKTKIIDGEWRLDYKVAGGGKNQPDIKYGPTSIRVLKKANATNPTVGPILSDWPENKTLEQSNSGRRTLAKASVTYKRVGWENYQSGSYKFQSMGSMLQVQIAQNNKILDHVIMGGRLSTTPIVQEDKVWFGSKDGYVYAYDLKEKKLAWKFLAAPNDERILYASQLESHWPIASIHLKNGKLHITAGRHEVTGGYFQYELNPISGEILNKQIYGAKPWDIGNSNKARFVYENTKASQDRFELVETEISKKAVAPKKYSVDGKVAKQKRTTVRINRDAIQNELDLVFYP